MSMPSPSASTMIERLRSSLPQLPDAQKRVAAYLLDNYAQALLMSTHQLAEAAGTSQASVTRFASNLGYKNYAEFQQNLGQIARHALEELPPIKRFSNAQSSDANALIERESRHLRSVLGLLKTEIFTKTVDHLANSDRVLVAGFGAAAPAALHAGLYLSRLRPNIHTLTSLESLNLVQLVHFSQTDYLLTFALPRYPKETETLMKLMQTRGVPQGLVINKASHRLTALAEQVLVTPISYSSTTVFPVAPIALASFLTDAVAQRIPKRTAEKLEIFEEIAKSTQFFIQEK